MLAYEFTYAIRLQSFTSSDCQLKDQYSFQDINEPLNISIFGYYRPEFIFAERRATRFTVQDDPFASRLLFCFASHTNTFRFYHGQTSTSATNSWFSNTPTIHLWRKRRPPCLPPSDLLLLLYPPRWTSLSRNWTEENHDLESIVR